MITHRDFESNCKRIAKWILKESSDTRSEIFDLMIHSETFPLEVSKPLMADFKANNRKYTRRINKLLSGECTVKPYYFDTFYSEIEFEIKFKNEFEIMFNKLIEEEG